MADKISWQSIEDLLKSESKENLMYVEDFVTKYSIDPGITSVFILQLGIPPYNVVAGNEVNRLWGEHESIIDYLKCYEGEKVKAVLAPLSKKIYKIKKLKIGPMEFTFNS
ncbi:MAG: hypothetical protein KKA79_02955 [Nanoarchaeota archaeon]|nr:hypothetical protein [Nanoarchaeota archaeon]MCG2717410.1 hypothetical protein [Nanoarchaeota archaeon]